MVHELQTWYCICSSFWKGLTNVIAKHDLFDIWFMYNSIRDRYYLYIGQILSITMSDVLSMTIHDAQNLQKSWRWVENTGLILSRCPYTSCPTQTNTQHKHRRTQSRDPPLHCVSSQFSCVFQVWCQAHPVTVYLLL